MSKIPRASRLKSLVYVCTSATAVFSSYFYMKEDEKFYEGLLIPALHLLNPETAHRVAVTAHKFNLVPRSPYKDTTPLKTKAWGLDFSNPVGMAAGFDKDAEGVQSLFGVGFGFVEIGSVTPEPQPGNNPPRVFRLSTNEAIINRYGFNSAGHLDVVDRVKQLKSNGYQGVLGVNLGKNKNSSDPVQDYVKGIECFGPHADYLVINISSPNTPGLREWQNRKKLEVLLEALVSSRNELQRQPPLLLKLSPDLTAEQCKEIAGLVLQKKCRVDGLVISNTTTTRNLQIDEEHSAEDGGLSGKPLADISTQMICQMYKLTQGKIPIIGVGGISTGQDAYEKIKAGASLVQLYTSYVYHGPPRVAKIKQELYECLRKDGFSSVSEAVGKGCQS